MSAQPRASPDGRWGLMAHPALAGIAFAAAGFAIHECARVASFEALYRDTMGGKPLPRATEWVLQYRVAFMMSVLFVPGAALATFALRERWQAMGVLSALIVFATLHGFFVRFALALPFVSVFRTMGGASSGP